MNLYKKINPIQCLMVGLLLACLFTSAVQADMGPAGSGITARANDASTVFWSPAGITRLEKPELVIQSTLVAMESKFNVDESNIGGGNADKDSKILVVPGMFYAQPLNDNWSAGFSLTVPSGFGNDYGKYWSGRYLSQENKLTFFALTGTVGYKFSDQWSIGGGPIIMYTDSTSKAQINNPGQNDGRIKLEEDGFGYGWQLGVLHDINDSARIGAVYRAEIDPDLSGKPEYSNLSPVYRAALENLGLFGQDIDVDFVVPQQIQLGYYQEFLEKWSFTLDGVWIDMSEFGLEHVSVGPDHVSLPSVFRDVWAYTTGLRYEYRSDLAFSVGAAYMTSPATDSKRSLALPLDRVLVYGAGVEWHWKGFEIHSNLNYADFGDSDIDQGSNKPLGPGRVKGSFDYNHAVILDMMFIKKF